MDDFLTKKIDLLSFVFLFSVVHDQNQFIEADLGFVENQWFYCECPSDLFLFRVCKEAKTVKILFFLLTFCLLTLIDKFLFEDLDFVEDFGFGTVGFGFFINSVSIVEPFFRQPVKSFILFERFFNFLNCDVSI